MLEFLKQLQLSIDEKMKNKLDSDRELDQTERENISNALKFKNYIESVIALLDEAK